MMKSVAKRLSLPHAERLPSAGSCPCAIIRASRPSAARTGRTAGGSDSPIAKPLRRGPDKSVTGMPARASTSAATDPAGPAPITSALRIAQSPRRLPLHHRRRRELVVRLHLHELRQIEEIGRARPRVDDPEHVPVVDHALQAFDRALI